MKTRKSKNEIRRKSKRGGQKVPYSTTDPWHQKYVTISQHGMDCSASVFSLLGYTSWKNSLYLASRIPNGLDEVSFLNILKQAYGPNMNWFKIKTITDIHRILSNGIATPASIEWDETGGHYFVIIKEKDNLIVLDPQSGDRTSLQTYLDKYKQPGYKPKNHFYIMDSENVRNGKNKVTTEIIDKVLGTNYPPAPTEELFVPPQRPAAQMFVPPQRPAAQMFVPPPPQMFVPPQRNMFKSPDEMNDDDFLR